MKRYKLIILFFLSFYKNNFAKSENNSSNFIFDHVKDSNNWHITTINGHHISIYLPVIIYSNCLKNKNGKGFYFFSSKNFLDKDHCKKSYNGFFLDEKNKIRHKDPDIKFINLSITKNIIAMFIGVIIMLILFIISANKMKIYRFTAPSGFLNLFESLVIFVRDDIVKQNIGDNYKKYTPYILTIFFFIWINNLLGLLPGSANVTGSISVSLSLAFLTLIITTFSAKKNYWAHIFKTPGVPLWLLPIMIPIEFIGIFIKPISLMVRLFANITAGHIILLSIINLIFILESTYVGFVAVPFGGFMMMLKLLVAFLQAYIFSLLTCIYIGSAVEDSH
jgi:F-type H+-transporting ATPase subunit a